MWLWPNEDAYSKVDDIVADVEFSVEESVGYSLMTADSLTTAFDNLATD